MNCALGQVDYSILIKLLRKRRLELGLLQIQVAKKLGVNKGTIVNWECNATAPCVAPCPGYR